MRSRQSEARWLPLAFAVNWIQRLRPVRAEDINLYVGRKAFVVDKLLLKAGKVGFMPAVSVTRPI
jgi:hypothetical protein